MAIYNEGAKKALGFKNRFLKPQEGSVSVRVKDGFLQLVYRISGKTFVSDWLPIDTVITMGANVDLIKDFRLLTQAEADKL